MSLHAHGSAAKTLQPLYIEVLRCSVGCAIDRYMYWEVDWGGELSATS